MKLIPIVFLSFLALNGSAQKKDSTLVYFDFDKYFLSQKAKAGIDSSIYANREIKDLQFMIKAHCDAIGSENYNDLLSEKRADAVKQYLLSQGIVPGNIIFEKGYGKRIPVNENHTAEERRLNRRAELIIILPAVAVPTSKEVATVPEPTPKGKQNPVSLSSTIDSAKQGETLRLQNINFYGGRHSFLPQSYPTLNELLEVMRSNPGLVIDIQGHICCFPGAVDGADYDAMDQHLSLNRARAVYEFLISGGIDKSRLSYQGFAGRFPLVSPEQTEADRTLNRRVEIKIIRK